MDILNSVDELLNHIKDVQLDVVKLSNDSLLKMSHYIEENRLEVDDNISTALQYQDIITQQLSASIEAIESMSNSIKVFNHAYENDSSLVNDSLNKLQDKLSLALKEAKDKKDRFSGKTLNADETEMIEFF
jgi:archaellum component FlaC